MIKFFHRLRAHPLLMFSLLALAAVVFTAHDFFLYPDWPAARIEDVVSVPDHTEYSFSDGREETCDLQTISAKIIHGPGKGSRITLTNYCTESNVYDTRYRKGDVVFLRETDGGWEITFVKRDVYGVAALSCLLLALAAVGRKKGLFAVISVAANGLIFYLGVRIYVDQGVNLLGISMAAMVLFTGICLTLIGGFTRMTAMSILGTLLGTLISFGLAWAVLKGFAFQGTHAWLLEFLVVSQDYKTIFLSELLIGGLGATMDIAMSISSALCELKDKDPGIRFPALVQSGREIGWDIIGTMTNVLLFTYLCGGVPLMVVAARSGMSIWNYLLFYNNLEILRFIVGSIGIVATVPVSIFLAAFLLSWERKEAERP